MEAPVREGETGPSDDARSVQAADADEDVPEEPHDAEPPTSQCSRSCADGTEDAMSALGDDTRGQAEVCDTDMDSRSCVPSDVAEGVVAEEHETTTTDAPAPSTADAPAPTKRKAVAKAEARSALKRKRPMPVVSPVPRSATLPPPPVFSIDGGASGSAAGHGSDADAAEGRVEPSEMEALRRELETLREQFSQQRRKLQASAQATNLGKQALADVLKRMAHREFSEENDRAQAAIFRFGHCRQVQLGPAFTQNTWCGGYEEEEIRRIERRIEEGRQNISRERVMLNKTDDDDKLERQDVLKHRVAYLSKEEQAIKERAERLQVDRQLHLKRQQRLEAARRSNFGEFPKLRDRYQLLNMLGRGGFSEVYRAFDLETNSYCAVKIHELGKDMSEVQRQSYIRRAMREYEIQKGLKHPRVVTLQDCFPISTRAFGTVLELCNGDTLDEYMKKYGLLAEREARGMIIQVLSGLKYLNQNETGNKIIHYDLKPGNLFFQNGEVKIADFGLSKIVHQHNAGESIELTSQGAGTYWYLPPECNVQASPDDPPKISNKVDVWSTGVIFYEMLFGKKPHGHGQSQEAYRRSSMAQGLDELQLPVTPKVSPLCEKFVKRLLIIDKDERPDVIEALADVYIRGVKKGKASDAGAQPQAAASADGEA